MLVPMILTCLYYRRRRLFYAFHVIDLEICCHSDSWTYAFVGLIGWTITFKWMLKKWILMCGLSWLKIWFSGRNGSDP
jgi:hypothetical protein